MVARRDEYQELFIGLIEDGLSAGVFTVSEVRVAAYAILLECTGVALWFDPAGSLSLNQVAEVHIELVLGSLGANRRTIASAIRATQDKPTPA